MEINRKNSLEACFVISGGLLVLYYFWRKESLLVAAIVFTGIGLLWPTLAKSIAQAWYKLAELLGRINGFLLLSLLYFLLLTPLALLKKLFGEGGKHKEERTDEDSYFIKRDYTYTSEDLKHPW